MKLTKKEIKLIEKSIRHWEKDIIKPLQDGDRIISGGMSRLFKSTLGYVHDNAGDCHLCIGFRCTDCPYYKYYRTSCCVEGHWAKYQRKPNLRTAKAMRDSLIKILEDSAK